ncbi:MAG: family 16 glycoside hydrolase [Verrucomicrobiota bacterium]
MKQTLFLTTLFSILSSLASAAPDRPNIVILFTDDISARELPLYGSSTWTNPLREDTSDPAFQAKTPVLNRIANEGCWIETAWSATVCSPSRAMMMTGRYAHIHKWWNNKDKGMVTRANGKQEVWPLYESSPLQLGHIAQKAGYGTFWAGKTQMAGDLDQFGYDEGCFTPGSLRDTDNPYTDFKHDNKVVDGKKVLLCADTNNPVETYWQHGWYFYPHVKLLNHKGKKDSYEWWPNTQESRAKFGPHTYGPDVELDFAFEFMERQVKADKPFLIYHCSHLGHDAYDWLNPDSKSSFPGTPIVKWTGDGYERTDVKITGDEGVYDTHGTITESGIHSHINYLDYQVWLYLKKFEELGIADNTLFVFASDNGTAGYGKNSPDRQKGTHVPLIFYGEGLTKKGKQDVLANLSDFLPTIADLTGFDIPEDYAHNGQSLVPFLYGDKPTHRDWIYAYFFGKQLIRGQRVMMDARDKWWDVSKTPADLISFPQITNWDSVSPELRAERDKLKAILPQFDLYETAHDAPGTRAERKYHASGKRIQKDKPPQNSDKQTSSPNKPSHDFIDLFASGDFSEWTIQGKPVTKGWTIQDGVVHLKPKAGNLLSKRKFKNFEMTFEWKISRAGNSGVKYRCQQSLGPEYQVLDDEKHQAGKRPDHRTGGLYELQPRLTDKPYKPAGEWNTARIIAKNKMLKHWLNGTKVVDIEIDSEEWNEVFAKSKFSKMKNYGRKAGNILLQDHNDEVWFRNVKIRELPNRE